MIDHKQRILSLLDEWEVEPPDLRWIITVSREDGVVYPPREISGKIKRWKLTLYQIFYEITCVRLGQIMKSRYEWELFSGVQSIRVYAAGQYYTVRLEPVIATTHARNTTLIAALKTVMEKSEGYCFSHLDYPELLRLLEGEGERSS